MTTRSLPFVIKRAPDNHSGAQSRKALNHMNPAQTVIPPATSDRRVRSFSEIPSPHDVLTEFPLGARRAERVARDRDEIADIVAGRDDRLLVVVGPCSVHDPVAALDYASRLAKVSGELSEQLKIVMRVYFEKPRTTIGWKGLINDPGMDGTFDVARGLRIARQLLLDIIDIGLPVGCEFLEPTSPQYIADAVAWGAIGARTTESQVHRQLASGLSMPVGFKNGTDGNIQVAVDGVKAAAAQHVFFGMDDTGRGALVSTAGNEDCHVILRGGTGGPNYDAESVHATTANLTAAGLPGRVVIDCSHANSGKDHVRQAAVAAEVAQLVRDGVPISGVMLESFLVAGAQACDAHPLTYGQSVTDKCMDWPTTDLVLRELAKRS